MPFEYPHQVLDRLNHDMAADFSNVGMFTTVMLGMVDCANCKLHFSNAGQSPIYYVPVNGEPVLLEAQDIPVGILDEFNYSTQSMDLSEGDVFIAATDGFPESRNPAGEMYGYERMKALISASRHLSAKQLADALLMDVNTFCDAHLQDDDRTIVVIRFEKQNEKRIMFNESLTIYANYQEIRQPCERLRTLLKQADVADEVASVCELSLQELLTNLVDHAYEGDSNGQITVRMASNRDQIFIQTEDTGIPANVNLNNIHMPEPEELAEGGYGMAIIQAIMDEVRYESSKSKNVWSLIKNLK